MWSFLERLHGFTGQFVVQEFAKQNSKNQLSWAVAGRNEDKLLSALQKKTAERCMGWCNRRVLAINISVIFPCIQIV